MIKFLISLFIILLLAINIFKSRLLSSSSLWMFCYELIFVLFPLLSLRTFSNESLIDVCALIGIIAYSIGVLIADRIKPYGNKKKMSVCLKPNYVTAYVLFWLMFFLFTIVLIRSIGSMGIQQTLNGVITSNQLTLNDDFVSSHLFIYVMNLMIPFVLAVWVSASNSTEKRKRIVVVITFIFVSVIFGYTRLFLVCILICILFFELRNSSIKKQGFVLLTSVIGLALLMVLLNFIRSWGTRKLSLFASSINISYILESTDFGASYRWFSELMQYESPYIIPVTYLKPLFVFIPRSVWPGKPEPLSLDILKMINPQLSFSGYSTAGNSVLGEGYAILGYLGIFLFPLIWGFITVFLDNRYYYRLRNGIEGSVSDCFYYLFSSFIILSCQRGDWSQYNIIIVWLFMIPLFVASKLKLRRIKFRLI